MDEAAFKERHCQLTIDSGGLTMYQGVPQKRLYQDRKLALIEDVDRRVQRCQNTGNTEFSIKTAEQYQTQLPNSQKDVIDEMANIEIDTRFPYRIGCPLLPVLPVNTLFLTRNFNEYIPDSDHHIRKLRNTLAKYKITLNSLFLARRTNGRLDNNDPRYRTRYRTIVLISDYTDGCQDSWVNAVKEIRADLTESNIHVGSAIELIDRQAYMDQLQTSPICSSDREVIEGWNTVRPEFRAMIRHHCWCSIDVLRRDFPSRKEQPTVIIGAQDANNETWWSTTLPKLHRLLETNKVKIDIVVFYLEKINLLNGLGVDPTILSEAYRNEIRMGTSCGVKGSGDSGTLGGLIKLQRDKSDTTRISMGLTNYHVLQDAFKNQEHTSGLFLPRPNQSYGVANVPSDDDNKIWLQKGKDSLLKCQDETKQLTRDLEQTEKEDSQWQSKKDLHDVASKKESALKTEFDYVQSHSREFGQIYAASRFRTCSNPILEGDDSKDWGLDWCLVQADTPKTISSILPDGPEKSKHITRGAKVTHYGSISERKNYEVAKRGRTTGWTKGMISAINSEVRLNDALRRPQVPTHPWEDSIFVYPVMGSTEVIRTANTLFADHDMDVDMDVDDLPRAVKIVRPFLKPGDSGSFVLLDEKTQNSPGVTVVGLALGGRDGTPLSYMMPIDIVVKDIEKVTNAEVVNLKYAGKM